MPSMCINDKADGNMIKKQRTKKGHVTFRAHRIGPSFDLLLLYPNRLNSRSVFYFASFHQLLHYPESLP